MRVGFFVIAYDAEAHIADTLGRIPPEVWEEIDQVYVVDDCSTDETVKRAMALKQQYPKLRVLRNRVNRRYGGNQKFGYQYAIEQGLDVVVMLHADGQYAPEIIRSLYQPIVEGKADVVLGSRMIQKGGALKGGMPSYKFVGNRILTRIQNALTGSRLSEFHTGYRAYRVDFLRQVPFWENTDEWHFDTEILLQAKAAKARVLEVPIPTYYGDEICHVNGIPYAMSCVWVSLTYFLAKVGVIYVRKFDVNLSGRTYFNKLSDPYSSHSLIVNKLKKMDLQGVRILELGVGDATLTEWMSKAGGRLTCVELNPQFADLARPFAEKVIVGNVEEPCCPFRDDAPQYDIIVAADILEHLVHPEIVLSQMKAAIKLNGFLVVSLPNVANWYVRLNLLFGRFPYHTKGLLDQTHLKFFTLKSMRKLATCTGWVMEDMQVTSIPLAIVFPFLRKKAFSWMLFLSYQLTRIFRGGLAYQGVMFCRNPNSGELL